MSDLESISEIVNASYPDEPRYQNDREKMRLTLLNGELQKTLLEASIQEVVDESFPNRAPYRKLRERDALDATRCSLQNADHRPSTA